MNLAEYEANLLSDNNSHKPCGRLKRLQGPGVHAPEVQPSASPLRSLKSHEISLCRQLCGVLGKYVERGPNLWNSTRRSHSKDFVNSTFFHCLLVLTPILLFSFFYTLWLSCYRVHSSYIYSFCYIRIY